MDSPIAMGRPRLSTSSVMFHQGQKIIEKKGPTSFQVWQPKMMAQVRTLRVPFAAAVLAASLVVALLLLGDYVPAFDAIKESPFDTSAYTSFASLIGFMTVFRTGQAYERFADGTMLIHQILGDWHDATSTLVAFCRYSDADRELIVCFQQKLVRLMSLLNAMILGELEGDEHVGDMAATRWELIDVSGLDRRLLEVLARSKSRPEIVFQWVQNEIVDNVKTGVLSIPAPLLTRAFQELASGMMKYHDAAKFARVPFPLPYTIVVELLLAIYAVVTPIVMSTWAEQPGWGSLFSFVLVFVVWSMHFLALELENPYGLDANDLDMSEIQCELNRHLIAALVHGEEKAELTVGAVDAVLRMKAQYRRKRREGTSSVVTTSFSSLGFPLKASSTHTLPGVSDMDEEEYDVWGSQEQDMEADSSTSSKHTAEPIIRSPRLVMKVLHSKNASSESSSDGVQQVRRVSWGGEEAASQTTPSSSRTESYTVPTHLDVSPSHPPALPTLDSAWDAMDCPAIGNPIHRTGPSGPKEENSYDWM